MLKDLPLHTCILLLLSLPLIGWLIGSAVHYAKTHARRRRRALQEAARRAQAQANARNNAQAARLRYTTTEARSYEIVTRRKAA
jgi:hypothetical protein